MPTTTFQAKFILSIRKLKRFAFENAVKNGRKKVTCFSKDNIMKFSDAIFHQVFDEIAKEYSQIERSNR